MDIITTRRTKLYKLEVGVFGLIITNFQPKHYPCHKVISKKSMEDNPILLKKLLLYFPINNDPHKIFSPLGFHELSSKINGAYNGMRYSVQEVTKSVVLTHSTNPMFMYPLTIHNLIGALS